MKQFRSFSIIWVAYNEEFNLEPSLLAALGAIKFYNAEIGGKISVKIVICHNGCTDRTPEIAALIKKKYADAAIKIDVISSSKGMVIAQNASVKHIQKYRQYNKSPVIFIDTDSLVEKNLVYTFLEQFRKHPRLKAVGAQPVPIPFLGWRVDKLILDKILNCRAYYPKAEIAFNHAPEYHPYADKDPQKIGVDFEKRSKIYFHGRCFALRNPGIWDVPRQRIGEDTYLDRSIHYRFGPSSIRHLYDTHIIFRPMTSLRDFVRTYYRIYKDLATLRESHSRFEKVREYSKTKLDWEYIGKLRLRWRLTFLLYAFIRNTCHVLFKYGLIYRNGDVSKIWSYSAKQKLNI
ncbi:MAG: hypothetical protein A3J47_00495 [Candidatus Yanofskybacteria bacterium RIFCSPHIGHO2_02_FULL_43_22]|uniref:Glycosyltransferase 2-like domain-containing protein n=1 Tax=Candidatus Yanofskybacteria bacterium RIFCSPHIGHO2_02_FULL_43_22 TaxID=1802681 RepID=A0A1F8FRE0_9BACT|nr:MAG: hypothetical protein A3J47_00495 [Candidatus Yanofskybacteria bacterium RIFCSPHIGHO2_02_FULL_43_22]